MAALIAKIFSPAAQAQALPQGPHVIAGGVNITSPSKNRLVVSESSPRAIIDWQSFTIGGGDRVVFSQPSEGAAILNRVTGSDSSLISGQIFGNGQIFLINPNGIEITPTGLVNVYSFVAATLDVSDSDFLSGSVFNLHSVGSGASVVNRGTIAAQPGGAVVLAGQSVTNAGRIQANLGRVGLAAADQLSVDLEGDRFLTINVPSSSASLVNALIDETGTIEAGGGQVQLKAGTSADIARAAINVSGRIDADAVSAFPGGAIFENRRDFRSDIAGLDTPAGTSSAPGSVIIDGGLGGALTSNANISARSTKGAGGLITLLGSTIDVDGGTLDTSGRTTGGSIRVGGDWHGGAALPIANTTTVSQETQLTANASQGNAGSVVVWSENATTFAGHLSQMGGESATVAADAEVSSHGTLQFTGTVNLRSGDGLVGSLLLDPQNVTIQSAAGTPAITCAAGVCSPTSPSSILTVSTLQSALATSNVVVNTGTTGTQAGNITVASPVTWASGNALTLTAAGSVAINAPITTTAGGSLNLQAGTNILVASTIQGTGGPLNVALTAAPSTGTISLTGGTVLTGGGSFSASASPTGATPAISISGSSISTAGGALSITGAGASGAGISLAGETSLNSGAGSINVSANSTSSTALQFMSNATLTTSGAAAINASGGGTSAVVLSGGNTITNSNGTLGIVGTATGGTAIAVTGASALINNGSSLTLSGTSSSSTGIVLTTGSSISAQGSVTLAGTTTSASNGIGFSGNNTVAEGSGTLLLNGYSTGYGVAFTGATSISNTSSGAVTINGSSTGQGVLFNSGSSLTSTGTTNVNGTAATGSNGISFVGGSTLSDNGGNLTLIGRTNTGWATLFSGSETLTNNGSGSLNILGISAGSNGLRLASGANLSASGAVSLYGDSNGASNGIYMVGTNNVTDQSGNLSLTGVSTSSIGALLSGTVALHNVGSGVFSIAGSSAASGKQAVSFSSGSSITTTGTVTASDLTGSLSTVAVDVIGTVVNSGGSLALNSVLGDKVTVESTGAVNESASGSLSISASTISLNGAISLASNNLNLTASTAVTQSAAITAGSVLLQGNGNFTLTNAGNAIETIAGQVSSASVVDSSSLTVGTLGSYNGITATGAITLDALGASSDLRIGAGDTISSQAAGTAIILAAGRNFINSDGNTALAVNSNARWLIYSQNPTNDTFGNLNSGDTAIWDATYSGNPPASINSSGNRYIFALQPTLSFSSTDATKTYGTNGTAAVAASYTVSGIQPSITNVYLGDTYSTVYSGTPSVISAGSATTATVGGGPYTETAAQGTLTSSDGYAFNFVNSGVLAVTPAALTVTANNQTKVYGQNANLGSAAFTDSGLLNSDSITSVSLASSGSRGTASVAGGPYSIVPSNAQGSGLSNYSISYINGTLAITPASLTITATSQTHVYGQTASLGSTAFTDSGLLNSDTVSSVSLSSSGTSTTATVAGGPYSIIASNAEGSGLSNYNISYVNGALSVTPSPLTITAGTQSKVYGQNANLGSTAFTDTGLLNSDAVVTVSLASSGSAAGATVAGGPYSISASNAQGSGLSNYNISYVNGLLSISPAPLTIAAGNQSKTYGQTINLGSTVFTESGLLNSDSISSVTLASNGSASTATVAGGPYGIVGSNAQGSGLSNYNISYTNGFLSIAPAPLTITASGQSKTYGETYNLGSTAFADSGLLNNDMVSAVTLASSGTASTATVAGSPYAIVGSNAQGSGLSNYNISYVSGAFSITPAPLTITASNQSKTYGQTTNLGSTAFSDSGLLNGDSVSSVTLTSGGASPTASVNESPYLIVGSNAQGSGLSNYNISYINGALSITPATLTITASNQSKVYGQTSNLGTIAFTEVGLLNTDSVSSVTLTSGGTSPTASVTGGPYSIFGSNAQGSGLPNYNISYVNGALSVTPAPLTITASDQAKVYGQTSNLGTSAYTDTGLLNNDSVSSITLTSGGMGPTASVAGGPYSIVGSSAQGSGLSNYNISYVNGALTVTPATLTITASNQSKVYGQTANLGSTAFAETGLVNGDSVSSVTLTSGGTSPTATAGGSSYAIVGSNAQGSGLSNYNIGYVNGALSVTPAALTITASDQSKSYGQTIDLGSTAFSEIGLLNSDSLTSVTLASNGSASTATVAGGPYAIVGNNAQGSGLSNYNISYINGTLSVTPAPLTITASNQSKVYGQTSNLGTEAFTDIGLLNNDSVSSITLTSGGTASTASVAGGPYVILGSNAQGSGLSNYSISYVNGSLSVIPAPLTITPSDQSKTYGQTANLGSTAFSDSGLLNSDFVSSLTLLSSGTGPTATVGGGPYEIVGSNAQGAGLANYSISYANGNLSIIPAPLTITASNQSKTYGQAIALGSAAFTEAGLLNGDAISAVSLASSGAASTATVAGSPYPIVESNAQGSGLSNYNISYVNGALSIRPAPLIITAGDQTKTYGQTANLGSSQFTETGLLNGDLVSAVSLTSNGSASTAAVTGGPYSIIGSNAQGSGLSNYSISYVNGALSVTPAPLTITAGDQTKTYGQVNNLGSTAFTETGLLNSDAVSSVTLVSNGTVSAATVAGGPYAIVGSNAQGQGLSNYNIEYVNGSLSVSPAPLTITSGNQSKTYGQITALGSTAFSDAGLLNGDSISSVTLASIGIAQTATVAGGPYPIVGASAQGTGLSNYDINYINGTLTVTPAPLTITANGLTKVYGQNANLANTAFNEAGLLNDDVISSVSLLSVGTSATASVAGGPYPIVVSNAQGSGLSNYTINYVEGTLFVTPAPLTITASNQSKVYGQNANLGDTRFTESGLLNNDSVTSVSLSSNGSDATASVNGGPYNIIASSAQGFGLSNYAVSYIDGVLSVQPKPLKVTPINWSATSGSPDFSYVTSVGALTNGDRLMGSLAGLFVNLNGNVYFEVTRGSLENSNYNIEFTPLFVRLGHEALAQGFERFPCLNNGNETYGFRKAALVTLNLTNQDGTVLGSTAFEHLTTKDVLQSCFWPRDDVQRAGDSIDLAEQRLDYYPLQSGN